MGYGVYLSGVGYGLAGGRCLGHKGVCVGHIGLCAGCGWWGGRCVQLVSPLLSCLVFGWFSLVFLGLCAMVAGGGEGARWFCFVERDLRIGVLEGFCRSLSGCFGSLFGPR